MKPLVHLLVGSKLTACGKRGWGMSDSEGATPDADLVNCPACKKTFKEAA